jgi:hypothetical protein
MPFDNLVEMVRRGEIVDSKTLLAVMWYRTFPSSATADSCFPIGGEGAR